jgi:DNA-binding NtrC family response regulator
MASLLLVDEDRDSCQLAKRVLSREGHIAEALTMPQEALAWLGGNVPSLAIASAGKYGEKARTTLELFKKAGISGSRIVLLAETGDLAAVRRSFGDSVLAVIEKDSSFERLIELIHTVEVEKKATTR